MKQITTISDDANQSVFVNLDDGTVVTFRLEYLPAIQRWQMDFDYGDYSAHGLLLSLHPNLLRRYRNVIPFGLACLSEDSSDPVMLKDFVNGRISLHVLSDDEVEQAEQEIFS